MFRTKHRGRIFALTRPICADSMAWEAGIKRARLCNVLRGKELQCEIRETDGMGKRTEASGKNPYFLKDFSLMEP